VLKGMADLKARAAKAGRDAKTLAVSVFAAKPDAADLAKLAEGGVTRAIFLLPSEGRDKVLPLLDQYSKLGK
jgi:alkanesulfonate monooxygenase SsuD/methylene tetrahydromethanopterin reductase-like flavin-dependent oxidoreductase (luciferase family)